VHIVLGHDLNNQTNGSRYRSILQLLIQKHENITKIKPGAEWVTRKATWD